MTPTLWLIKFFIFSFFADLDPFLLLLTMKVISTATPKLKALKRKPLDVTVIVTSGGIRVRENTSVSVLSLVDNLRAD